MKIFQGPKSFVIKILLLVLGFLIAGGTLFYTHNLVEKLQHKDKQIVELYAKGLEYLIKADDPSNLTFIFENVIKPIDFPIILTDPEDKVDINDRTRIKNIHLDSTLSKAELQEYLQNEIIEMDKINPPIIVSYNDTIVLNKIHYGDSNLIKQLRNYPYFQIAAAAMLIFIGYLSFSSIKKREQGNIWVGMARETAHQLGTPISSLMGWSEILRMSNNNPDKVLDISEEINNDLTRLKKISNRFSKIGSNPELKEENIHDIIQRTLNYFQRRLPQTGKNITLSIEGNKSVCGNLNVELFEWVLENLIKNALDAIEGKKGSIAFFIADKGRNIEIDVKDSGKGIEVKRRKDIFRPGVTTKKRGWGLGLSLSKRIVEEYHKGKIFVKSSGPEGTTFKIVLKKA